MSATKQALSKKFYEAMEALRPCYPIKTALILPALHAAQAEAGWLPDLILDEVAAYIGVHPAQIREVASFYTMFHLKQPGKYDIRVCTNVACKLRGADHLMVICEKKLGILAGEKTRDGQFSLHHEECLGSCGTAPVMMVNEEYYENLDEQQLHHLMDAWSKQHD